MIIYFVKPFTDAKRTYEAHVDYDVKNEDAKRYVEAGVARKSPEPVTARPEDEPAAAPLKPGEHQLAEVPAAEAKKPAAKPLDAPENPAPIVPAVEPQASVAGAKKTGK